MSFNLFRGGVSRLALFAPETVIEGDGAPGAGDGGGAPKDPAAGGGDKGGTPPAADGAPKDGAKPGEGGTLLNGEPVKDGGKPGEGDGGTPPAWPPTWREQLAGGDAKVLERLKRLGSPEAMWTSYRALEQRVSSGELKATTPFPEKGTDAEKTTWREQNGVPAAPDGYKIELGNGMVVGEADKPMIEAFTKKVHGLNWSGAQVNQALQTYYEIQDAEAQQVATGDASYKQEAEDALRVEYGAEFRRNTNLVDNALGALPDGLGKLLAGGRLADGRRIGDDPRVFRWLLAAELERNPAATLIPPGGDPLKSVDGRLAEIRKFRQENPDKYDADKKMQEEELKLLDIQERQKPKGQAA